MTKLAVMESQSDLVGSSMTSTASRDVSKPSTGTEKQFLNREAAGVVDEESQDDKLGTRGVMVLVAMSFLWTTSQIPLYFYGGSELRILEDIQGYDNSVWIALGNLLPLAIITPFVGSLSDMFGRKAVGIAAFIFVIIGNIICAVSPTINVFIVGSVFMGVGAGLGELIALAVTGEIAPKKKRGLYVAGMHTTILLFCPAVLYSELISYAASWRWLGLLIGLWSLIGLVLTCIFYKPRPRSVEFTRSELARRIDYIGAFLSAAGLTLFLLGLVFAANGDPWTGAKVLAPFLIGAALIVLFVVWETWFVKYPMFPGRLKQNPRVLTIILIITFVSGANFFAVLIFWASQYQAVYAANNPVSQGVGSLPIGFGIILGSMITTLMISVSKGRIRMIMIIATAVMTAGNGAMACATPTNLPVLYFVVTLACIGVGAVIVPNQVIASLITPPDLAATITAATIAMRIIGGAIAYAIYYDVFSTKLRSATLEVLVPVAARYGITSPAAINQIVSLIRGGGFELIREVPGVSNATIVEALTVAGRQALSDSYPIVYYVSIPFGAVAFIASWFLTDLKSGEMAGGAAVKL